MNTVSVDRGRITLILQDINNLYAATIESENRRSVLNRIERIHNELAALTQPEQAAPCANCSGSGITPTGDGYSVDACPQCTPEQPEAGRDDAIAALVRFCEAKEHHFAVEDRHALSAILAGVKGRPQAQEPTGRRQWT